MLPYVNKWVAFISLQNVAKEDSGVSASSPPFQMQTEELRGRRLTFYPPNVKEESSVFWLN